MKNIVWMIFGAAILPAFAFAHGSKIDMTGDGIVAALSKFSAEESAQAPNFAGVKGWIDSDKVMVKVYLAGNANVTYACTMTEAGNGEHEFNCAKSQ